jgi:putative N6-adenine-specific DNA methylase
VDRYFAIVARGIEQLTARELEAIGAQGVTPTHGGVQFEGTRDVLYRALLTVRTASRILKPLREFAATTPDIVYSQVRRVVWEAYLTPQRTLAVSATADKPPLRGGERRPKPGFRKPPQSDRRTGRSSPGGSGPGGFGRSRDGSDLPAEPLGGTKWLYNTMFAALKIKDAICDRLKSELGARPDVDKERPDLQVQAHFSRGRCVLSLDASGTSLHERGYRDQSGGAAPLKETLAAAILQLTGWNGLVPLYDPMCGSGTLVIEAAQMALRIPAGGGRRAFACEKWPDFDGRIWANVLTELRSHQRRKLPAPIFGSDASPSQLEAAKDSAFRAHVDSSGLSLDLKDIEEIAPPVSEPGLIVTNPPYGIRLGDTDRLEAFYIRLGEILRERFSGWIVFILSGNDRLSQCLGMRPTEEFSLWNGPIPCKLLKFDLSVPVILMPTRIRTEEPESRAAEADPSIPVNETSEEAKTIAVSIETPDQQRLTEAPLLTQSLPSEPPASAAVVQTAGFAETSFTTVPVAWTSPFIMDTTNPPWTSTSSGIELPELESDHPT